MSPDRSTPGFPLSEAERLLQLGTSLLTARSYAKAAQSFQASLALDNSQAYAHAGLALALSQLKQSDAANREANLALQLEPHNSIVLYVNGQVAKDSGNLKVAQALMQQAIAIDPNNPDFFVLLSDVLMMQRRYKESEAAARKALALNPENATAHRIVGRILARETMSWDTNLSAERKQRRAEGQWHLAESLRLEPENARGHHLLGTYAHNPTQKVEHLSESLRLNPLDKEAQWELASARSIERDLRLHVWFWNLIAGRLPPHLRLPVAVLVGVGLLAGAMAFPSRSDASTICGLSFFLLLVYLRIAVIARPALVSPPRSQAVGEKDFTPPAHR